MNQELVDYIKQQMSLSVSKNKITDVLLGQGWQQPELDEAFAVAEGAANAATKVSYDNSESVVEDDVVGEERRGGINRKMILIGAVTLVIVLGIGGTLLLFSSKKGEKPQPPVTETKTEVPVVTAPADQKTETGNDVGFGQDPKVDNTPLIKSATRLENSITAPAGWELREGIKNDLPLVGYFKPNSEKDSAGKDIFQEYVLINSDSLKAANTTTTADYVAKSIADLTAGITDFKITAQKDVTIADGSAAKLIGCSYTEKGSPARCIQLIAFKGDEVYVVTGFVLGSNWEAEKDMMGTTVMSFKFPTE